MSAERAIEQLIDAHREMHPELYEKVDAIAQIIDPSAWPGEAFDGTGPDAKPIDWESDPRVQYMRTVARGKAFEVLELLALNPLKGWASMEHLAKAWGWKSTPPEQP